MSNLREQLQKLMEFPNGEQVAKRMIQLLDIGLRDENIYPSIDRVLDMIGNREEALLHRSFIDVVQKGKVIEPFKQAMIASSDDEWQGIKVDLQLLDLPLRDIERIFSDASGLVDNTEFKEWIIEGRGRASAERE